MKKPIKKIAAYTLLAFLFSGLGATSILPILITTLAHAHPIYITEENRKIHLVLHHPGNNDEHEAHKDADHRHDLFDTIIDVSRHNKGTHTDHEVELPSLEDKISTTTKSFVDVNAPTFSVNSPLLPVTIEHAVGHRLPHSPQIKDPPRESLRTTILII